MLDEIGSMPIHLQSKLLGVLEEKKIRRIGSETVKPISVRIIAAANNDLEEAIKEKHFEMTSTTVSASFESIFRRFAKEKMISPNFVNISSEKCPGMQASD